MKVSLCFTLSLIAVTGTLGVSHSELRAQEVARLNSLPGMTWKAGINERFAGAPLGISKSLLGVHESSKTVMMEALVAGKATLAPKISSEEASAIPASFDAAVNWPQCADMINDIRDQSNCGCCWAFGAAEAASDRLCIASNGNIKVPLSAQDVCFCASWDGCNGGDLYTPWSFIQSTGVVSGGGQGNGTFDDMGFCSKFSLPHCHHHGPQGNDPYPDEGAPGCPSESSPSCPSKCDITATSPHNVFSSDKYTFSGQVTQWPQDVATIQKAVMDGGSVEVAFTVYSDFENYVSGVYQNTGGQMMGGHAVKLVGWGTDNGVDYWKIANSWNPYWGEKGFFRIKRGTNECGIESQATSSSTGATWTKN
jgi:cathepsin B